MAYRLLLSCLLATALAYTVVAQNIPMDAWSAAEAVNSRTLPTVYGVLLSLVLLYLLMWGAAPGTAAMVAPGQVPRAVGIVVLAGLFVVSLAFAKLWFGLAVLLFASSAWLGERRWLLLASLSILIPLAGWLGVERLLGVYLPG